MATRYVNTLELNFRNAPRTDGDTRIGSVYLGQRVDDVEDTDTAGWVSCSAVIDGEPVAGFVSSEFLRLPLTEHRERLLAEVHREWMRFDRGEGLEHHPPFAGFVGEMWRALGESLDGTDRQVPWSAAAISFMVRNAGPAYAGFRFAAAHSQFVNHAIRARFDGDRSVPFWGFRLDEVRPEPGDIVCRDNPVHAPEVTFDVARVQPLFRSHTDIVAQVGPGRALAIGGNLGQSVRAVSYDLTTDGFVADSRNTFAVLRNITDDPRVG